GDLDAAKALRAMSEEEGAKVLPAARRPEAAGRWQTGRPEDLPAFLAGKGPDLVDVSADTDVSPSPSPGENSSGLTAGSERPEGGEPSLPDTGDLVNLVGEILSEEAPAELEDLAREDEAGPQGDLEEVGSGAGEEPVEPTGPSLLERPPEAPCGDGVFPAAGSGGEPAVSAGSLPEPRTANERALRRLEELLDRIRSKSRKGRRT
ncbi:MAG: hypothetical protein ACE5IM_14935, partial [Nitrospinota bacterium]